MTTNVPRISNPQEIPVAGVDDHLPPVLSERLQPQALRQRFAMPPAWLPEIPGDGARFNPNGPDHHMNWATVIGVATALIVGGGVLMATIAFSAQRYFEYQTETSQGRIASPIQ